MAGNPGDPALPEDNKPEDVQPPAPPPKPMARNFHCAACGGSVTVKYPGASLSVTCDNCKSVIDVTNENYKILSMYYQKTEMHKPAIPLGTRGKLDGKLWEVIGFMQRSDVASGYAWREYLLFNPYYGYRWLVEDKGKWNFVRTTKEKPETKQRSPGLRTGATISYDDKTFKIYNSGKSRVDFVLGEFYWRVILGSEVEATDYICPPQMVSSERDNTEVVWSVGNYIEAKEIEKAFKVEGKLPRPYGFGAIQPSKASADWKKMWPLWAIFSTVLTCMQIFSVGTAKNVVASDFYGNFLPNQKLNDVTVPKFTLDKNVANVGISLNAPVSNSWFWVSGEMVNNNTGASYPFEMTAEYYFGYDSDGSWSEGSNVKSIDFSQVPGGEYYINLDAESGDFKNLNQQMYTLTVRRDVPTYANYFWFLFFVSIPAINAWIRMRGDEVARWSNSDFNPYVSSE